MVVGMTEETTHFTINDVLVMDLHPGKYNGITIDDFSRAPLDLAPRLVSIAYLKLADGGALEFEVPDFGQMMSLYTSSMGVNQRLWDALTVAGGKVWDERGIAKVVLEQGFYRAWTGKLTNQKPCWMWVKAIKLKLGADIDASDGNHQGSPGEDPPWRK